MAIVDVLQPVLEIHDKDIRDQVEPILERLHNAGVKTITPKECIMSHQLGSFTTTVIDKALDNVSAVLVFPSVRLFNTLDLVTWVNAAHCKGLEEQRLESFLGVVYVLPRNSIGNLPLRFSSFGIDLTIPRRKEEKIQKVINFCLGKKD